MRRYIDGRSGQEYVDYGMGFVAVGAITTPQQFIQAPVNFSRAPSTSTVSCGSGESTERFTDEDGCSVTQCCRSARVYLGDGNWGTGKTCRQLKRDCPIARDPGGRGGYRPQL